MEPEWEEFSMHRILSQVMRLYFARNYRMLEKLQVHPGQVPVLFELRRCGGLYLRELCDHLYLRPSTVTVMVRRMEKNGLVRRRPDSKDQRMVRIDLTPKGEETVQRLAQATREMEKECLAGFSREEILLMGRFALQIRDNLNKASETPEKEGNLC